MSGRVVRRGGRDHTHLIGYWHILTVNASNGSYLFLAFWLNSVHVLEPVLALRSVGFQLTTRHGCINGSHSIQNTSFAKKHFSGRLKGYSEQAYLF